MAAAFLTALLGAQGSGAVAQDRMSDPTESATPEMISRPVVQSLPVEVQSDTVADEDEADVTASSLAELVGSYPHLETLTPEMRCLAGAIYFESKGETLPGQLAVARVVVNRAESGRFPDSYCGVVFQRSQFSFVRGRSMPAINTRSRSWREAVAIAQIADGDEWRSPVEGALFFHARHVSPRWRLTRMARVDNHIFYR